MCKPIVNNLSNVTPRNFGCGLWRRWVLLAMIVSHSLFADAEDHFLGGAPFSDDGDQTFYFKVHGYEQGFYLGLHSFTFHKAVPSLYEFAIHNVCIIKAWQTQIFLYSSIFDETFLIKIPRFKYPLAEGFEKHLYKW